MPNLKDTRKRIESVKNTQKITKAMKMVAAAKLRRAQNRLIAAGEYFSEIDAILSRVIWLSDDLHSPLIHSGDKDTSPFSNGSQTTKELIVVISSDRGLCGGFNTNLNKTVATYIKDNPDTERDLSFIGRRSYDKFKKHCSLNQYYEGFYDNLTANAVYRVADDITSAFLNHEYYQVRICFNKFHSVLVQEPTLETLLPVTQTTPEVLKDEIVSQYDYIFEPHKRQFLDQFLKGYIRQRLLHYVLQSYAGEFSARMTAMDNATNNATEVIDSLTLLANRLRQAAITSELIEIVNGAQALEG